MRKKLAKNTTPSELFKKSDESEKVDNKKEDKAELKGLPVKKKLTKGSQLKKAFNPTSNKGSWGLKKTI